MARASVTSLELNSGSAYDPTSSANRVRVRAERFALAVVDLLGLSCWRYRGRGLPKRRLGLQIEAPVSRGRR